MLFPYIFFHALYWGWLETLMETKCPRTPSE